jgi:PKD repeat protein
MPTNGTMSKEGCAGVFYDPGGPNGNYPNNCSSTLIIHAPGATSIVLTIEEFDIEPGAGTSCNYDYIAFYNGNSTSAPKINNTNYCNNTGNPGTISSTGEYITIYFYSDLYVNYAGFKIVFQCMGLPTPPKANFSANMQTTCLGLIEFTDKSSNEPIEWLWDFGDGETSVEQNPVHQYTKNGSYSVSLTVTNEDGSDIVLKEDFITVEIPEPPEIEDIIVCKDEEFEIVLDWEGTAYWYENITDEEPIYVGNTWAHPPIEENTTYFLREISEAPEGSIEEFCISFFTEALIIPETCVSISENSIENITIYPNPTKGQLIIENGELKIENVEIFDMMGRKVQSLTFNVQSSEFSNFKPETLNISNLPAGMYFIRIQTEKETITKKVIKN